MLAIVSDDAGEHADGDVVHRAGTKLGLDEIAENVNAGAHFGDAFKVAGVTKRRSRSYTDDIAAQTLCPQALRCLDSKRPFLLRHRFKLVSGAAVVGGTRVTQHARKALPQAASNLDQLRICRRDAGAMPIAVDFDQHGD